MRDPQEYRQHARDCLALAATINDPDQREQLLAIVEAWVNLAEQAERREAIIRPAPR
jgi:hypothetical protein